MSDRTDRGGGEPGQAEQRANGSKYDDEQEVQVEARALDEATLLFTDNQSDGAEKTGNANTTKAQCLIERSKSFP